MEAEQESTATPAARVTAAEKHLERMKKLEGTVRQLFENKLIGPVEPAAQTYFRLEAERTLAQVKGK
jgi:hypothetical protein